MNTPRRRLRSTMHSTLRDAVNETAPGSLRAIVQRRLRALAAGMLLALFPALTTATPDAAGEREIRQLITFVGSSGCTFIRNGDAHAAPAAAEHLAMKYGKARSRLATAEQFIDKVASRSYFTGEDYHVRCPGQPEQASGAWLRRELLQRRAQVAAVR